MGHNASFHLDLACLRKCPSRDFKSTDGLKALVKQISILKHFVRPAINNKWTSVYMYIMKLV